MPRVAKTFRVFVSSTFNDLKAERNKLHKDVFPKLREFCQKKGASFQAIDLRWGVSEEAGLDQQTMKICLGEIERCHEVTPRPNFLILLGQHYGWCPLPAEIPDEEFRQILEVVREKPEDRALLAFDETDDGDKGWYRLDENAVPTVWTLRARRVGEAPGEAESGESHEPERWYCLEQNGQPPVRSLRSGKIDDWLELADPDLKRSDPAKAARDAEARAWKKTELELRDLLHEALEGLGFSEEQKVKYVKSATEQEIRAGALRAEDIEGKVFSFFRKIEKARNDQNELLPGAGVFVDKDESAIDKLKAKLTATHEYTAEWDPDARQPKLEHLDDLATKVKKALEDAIRQELKEPTEMAGEEERHIEPDAALDVEGQAHCDFADGLLKFFVGRDEQQEEVAKYFGQDAERLRAIQSAGGGGKSALMAKLLEEARAAHPEAEIVYRFIGATPASSDGRTLLDGLCRELARRYGESEDTPSEYRDLVVELGKRMELATAQRPLVFFVDALDQLLPRHGARNLTWLPNQLPENVWVVVSTRPEEIILNNLRPKVPTDADGKPEWIEVGPMKEEEGRELLGQWLDAAGRTLQGEQMAAVLDRFKDSRGLPLYLKLAFEEARRWASWEEPEDLAVGISADGEGESQGIIRQNLFPRLAEEDSHGKPMVASALGYLAASRYGLAEEELLDALSRDPDLYASFLKGAFHVPPDLVEHAEKYLSAGNGNSTDVDAWLKALQKDPDKEEELRSFLAEVLPKPKGPRLPVVLWSRLSFDLAPYLTEREAEGVNLLGFYHRELQDSAKAAFLGGSPEGAGEGDQEAEGDGIVRNRRLAEYFRVMSDPKMDRSWGGGPEEKTAYPRGLAELPYHLTEAHEWQEIYETLTNFPFLEHKAKYVSVVDVKDAEGNDAKLYTGVLLLQDDYDHALEHMPGASAASRAKRPIILTPVDFGDGYVIQCPFCNKRVPFQEEWHDQEMKCPEEGCGGPWKLNPFKCERPSWAGKSNA